MKKSFLVILLSLFFVFTIAKDSLSAPCYGTMLPQKGRFLGGFQTHSTIERTLEDSYGTIRSLQHFFQFSYGITEWFSIDLKGGVGSIKQHPSGSDEVDYPSSFAGGYGFRIKLLDNDEKMLKAVFGFQHISVHPHSVRINGVKNTSILDDWQVSLLVSKDIYNFIPYLGIKWSRLDYIHWQNGIRERKMSDLTKSIGLVLGIDIPFFMETWINLEGHFLDEKAASLSIVFEF